RCACTRSSSAESSPSRWPTNPARTTTPGSSAASPTPPWTCSLPDTPVYNMEVPMQSLDHDRVSLRIDAPPDVVYALVSDVTRTPQFSPEVRLCTWLDGATGPTVGARFEAVNQASQGRAWKNRPVVTVAEPGREFAFSRTEKFAGTIVWRYELEP